MTRHSHEDALSEAEYQTLFEASDELHEPFRRECRFILVACGRLGLRAGELCHLDESWVNWQKSQIQIPRYDPCDGGRNGGVCGYCKDRARKAAAKDDDLTIEEAYQQRWGPKTSNSARAIPFDFSEEIRDAVVAFFFYEDAFEPSRSAVNRRVDRVLERAGWSTERTYPHALRATAASWHAYRGLAAPALQSLFGWSDLTTAMKYIRLSGGATQEALYEAHSD